ncbi:GapS6a family protein [Aeromonas enteropelogenes]|uniref:GapS6a family protein n=1 Tax=Aeromonas enteropelogenes TaxID=29489 RepID=UPI003BA21817
MDFLTATILSGLIYDGVKAGAAIGFDMLKSKLQGWIVDDVQIQTIVEQLKEAGIHEELAPHAIERRINEQQPLLRLLQEIKPSPSVTNIYQSSNIGHNINSNGGGNISVGSIITNKNGE